MAKRVLVSNLITHGEAARKLGVAPSAISNWRFRHADFPLPLLDTSHTQIYDWSEVERWFKAKKDRIRMPRPVRDQRSLGDQTS